MARRPAKHQKTPKGGGQEAVLEERRRREDAVDFLLDSMASKAWRSPSLVNNLHCCKKPLALNKQLTGLAGKIRSIENLFLVVHNDHPIAAQPTKKTLLDCLDNKLIYCLRSSKEEGDQLTCSQSLMQHHISFAKEQ